MNVIYKLTAPNGKAYIGQTTRGFTQRMREHEYNAKHGHTELIYIMIREYGWENFTKEVIMECEYDWELDTWEKGHITEYNTLYPNGYNMTDKSVGQTAEVRKKMSAAAKLRPSPPPFERKNGLDQDLPKHVMYVPSRDGYRIEGHPNCKSRAFYDSNLTLEEKKQLCLDFLAQLDAGLKVEDKPRRTLPKYIHPVKNGYSIHIGNKTIKTFQKKSNTLEQNLQLTIDYLDTYLQEKKL